MQNKPNSPRFCAKNEDFAQKQTQFKPNSNPIKPNSNPIQTQSNPISKAFFNVSFSAKISHLTILLSF